MLLREWSMGASFPCAISLSIQPLCRNGPSADRTIAHKAPWTQGPLDTRALGHTGIIPLLSRENALTTSANSYRMSTLYNAALYAAMEKPSVGVSG